MSTLAAQGIRLDLIGNRVLDGVTCRFEPGRISAIVGPNGAGKSTLLSCLAGLRLPDAGRALLDDADIAAIAPRDRARAIGFLPQTQEVHWDVTARALVGLGRLANRGPFAGESDGDVAAIDAAMEAMDVVHFAERPVMKLSGGERARVLLARVLAGEPRWILADEPLANLDIGHQHEVLRALHRAAAESGIGVIMVLHDLAHAMNAADHAVLLERGESIAEGTPAAILSAERLTSIYGVRAQWVDAANGRKALLTE